jgi:hypothetical protein
MNEEKPSPSLQRSLLLKGIVWSNAFAFAAFAIAYTVTNWNEQAGGILSFSEFVLVPLVMGVIAMRYWTRTKKRMLALFPYALLNTATGILLVAAFMHEGYICILIVSPLILAFMWIGIVIARYLLPDNRKTLRTSTLLLFVAMFVYDTFSEHSFSNVVTDEFVVDAPRHIVWKYVSAHPVNMSKNDYWLFRIGLPSPIQSTVTGDSIGADRKCIFSNGATFDERVSEIMCDSLYTFDVVRQPEDPEIIGHIQILRGQFILKKNLDGSTQLIGKSWYKLRVYPAWYYDFWAEDITREVHLRVMKHIKRLAENDV